MTTEQIFKFGVTPKSGDDKGKRFTVKSITPMGVDCGERYFNHGDYELWREPATLFEDSNIPSTLGNLKKAAESKGLSDDTPIWSHIYHYFEGAPANFSLGTLNGKPCIFIA